MEVDKSLIFCGALQSDAKKLLEMFFVILSLRTRGLSYRAAKDFVETTELT